MGFNVSVTASYYAKSFTFVAQNKQAVLYMFIPTLLDLSNNDHVRSKEGGLIMDF